MTGAFFPFKMMNRAFVTSLTVNFENFREMNSYVIILNMYQHPKLYRYVLSKPHKTMVHVQNHYTYTSTGQEVSRIKYTYIPVVFHHISVIPS